MHSRHALNLYNPKIRIIFEIGLSQKASMQFQKLFLFWDLISSQHAWNASVEMVCLLVIQIETQAVCGQYA